METTAPGTIAIRSARPDDAEALAEIYSASAEHHLRLDPSLYTRPARDALVERYRSRLPGTEDAEILVAEVDDEVVGSLDIRLQKPSGEPRMLRDLASAEIDIAVLPELRSSGIGTRLMEAAETWAADHGAEIMTLQVHVANLDAIRFYQDRHGWRTSGLFLMKRPERRP